jgi:hypothetical protein
MARKFEEIMEKAPKTVPNKEQPVALPDHTE